MTRRPSVYEGIPVTRHLFSCDMLGTNTGHYPRRSKKYADIATGAYPEPSPES